MAGSIPPLVSSSPPPLCAYDEEDEEDEDEFGVYAAAEEIDYNGCISYREKNVGEQSNKKSCPGEQDTTSQDSATDSGLCPDSEGVSPTPHSDEERTVKLETSQVSPGSSRLSAPSGSEKSVAHYGLQNGHLESKDDLALVDSNSFGNFNFIPAPSENARGLDARSGPVQKTNFNSNGDEYEHLKNSKSLSTAEGLEPLNHQQSEHDPDLSFQEPESDEFGSFEATCNTSVTRNELLSNDSTNDNVGNFKSTSTVATTELSSFNNKLVEAESSVISSIPRLENSCISSLTSTVPAVNDTEGKDFCSFQECAVNESVELHKEPGSLESNLGPNESFTNEFPTRDQGKIDNIQKGFFTRSDNVDFENEKSKDTKETVSLEFSNENKEDDEFDDFTDFKANFSSSEDFKTSDPCKTSAGSDVLVEDPAKLSEDSSQVLQDNSDDEFANFADFSSSDSTFVSAQSSNSIDNTPHIPVKSSDDTELRTDSEFQDWVSVFPEPAIKSEISSTSSITLLKADDPVWLKLKTLDTTPALTFHWTDSLANRTLLKALNIDSRNILFMPWSNSGVPRFAANLSCGPLEPVKATDPLQPGTMLQPVSSSAQESVPDAHFDWGSSGLTNPLDLLVLNGVLCFLWWWAASHSSLLDLNFVVTVSTHLTINPKPVLNLPKVLSAEAETILGSLRNLAFMRKNYIVFPLNDT